MGQMIVTCDHCGTRYKLDEAKIPGRGARVTCPSCKHVFVVYRKPEGTQEAAASAPPPAKPSQPSIEDEIASLDPDNLDFRSVGIASWKVKVKIGLVYDFNDFKTIDKYIREGRVSGSDLLSHDGESWLPIEEIADLRRHFCEVYVRARRALEAPDDDEDDFNEDEPTRIMQSSPAAVASKPKTLSAPAAAAPPPEPTPKLAQDDDGFDFASAMAEASADVDAQAGKQPTGPRFVDPFEAKRAARGGKSGSGEPRRSKPRPRKAPSSPSPTNSSGGGGGGSGRLIAIAVVTLAVVFGGLYYTTIQASTTETVAAPAPPPASAGAAPDGAGSDNETAADIRNQIMQQAREAREAEPEVPEGYEADGSKKLYAVRPEDRSDNRRDDGLNGGTFDAGSKSASEYASAGQIEVSNGDWRKAAQNYCEAYKMEPGNRGYAERCGEAQLKSGNTAAAESTLVKAKSLGSSRALRFLGDIARKNGDDGAAQSYYGQYLDTNPPDRAAVELLKDNLGG